VAITRAQEHLYLIGIRTDDTLWHLGEGEFLVVSSVDYQDWIMPALLQHENEFTGYTQGAKPWKIRTFKVFQQQAVETVSDIHSLGSWRDSLLSASPVDELWTPLFSGKGRAGSFWITRRTGLMTRTRSWRSTIPNWNDTGRRGKN